MDAGAAAITAARRMAGLGAVACLALGGSSLADARAKESAPGSGSRSAVSPARGAWQPKITLGFALFSFHNGRGGPLRCVIEPPLRPAPWLVRCDGTIVGGNRAAVRSAANRCDALGRKYQVGAELGGLELTAGAAAKLNCVGDAVEHGPFIPSGKSVRYGPFTCTALSAGLSCRARSGHGFFFGHTTWRTF